MRSPCSLSLPLVQTHITGHGNTRDEKKEMKAIVSKCSVIFAKTFILLLSHFLYLLSLTLPSTFPVHVHFCSLHITSFTHLLLHCFCSLPTSFNLSYYSSLNLYFLPLFCNASCTFPSFHRNTSLSTAF